MSDGVDRNAALRDRTKAYASRVIKLYSISDESVILMMRRM
jgi:hypothetical protein